MVKRFLTFLCSFSSLFGPFQLFSQLNVVSSQQSGNWADYYVQNVLLGSGVTAFNATFSTDSVQIGEFTSNNTSINMQDGLLMSTGNVLDAPGPNSSGSTGTGLSVAGDNDLFLLGGNASFDAAILEFDFVPSGDTVRFNYIFSSDEYNEFVNAGVNDAFGFFLSGPGIAGGQGYVNDAVNIALIPGTTTGVSIDDVNLGSNSAYYINNDQLNTGTLEYDGLTTKLQAVYPVNCTDTYHIKLAIGDGGDGVWDSGVFLEGGSFGSNLIEVDISSVNGDSTINEGCGEAAILFSRSDTNDTSITYIEFTGSATNGVDFDELPDTLIMLPGIFDTTIVITPYFDGINEGVEFITIKAISVTACNDTFTSEGTLYIFDVPDFGLLTSPDSTIDCPTATLDISSVAQGGGPPPFIYQWNTGQTGDSITVNLTPGPGIDTFAVEVFDSCGLYSNVDTILIYKNYQPDPIVTIIDDTNVNCIGDLLILTTLDTFGIEPYSYLWSSGDTTQSSEYTVNGPLLVSVTITDQCGVTAVDTATIEIKKVQNFRIQGQDTLDYCIGSELYVRTQATGAVEPYTYSWNMTNPVFNDSSNQRYLIFSDTLLRVWAQDACGRMVSKDITVNAIEVEPLNLIAPDVNPECPNDSTQLRVTVSGGLEPYQYNWSNGDTLPEIKSAEEISTQYIVTVTDFCSNVDTASSLVIVNDFSTLRISVSGGSKVCYGEEYIVELLGYGGAGRYRFDWQWKNEPLLEESFTELDNGIYSMISQQPNWHYFTITDFCNSTITDSVRIEIKHCLEIPNVLSPDGDGVNDVFVINNIEQFTDSRLTVYNRWGGKVLNAEPYLNDWNPQDEPSGTYFYILTSENFPQMRGEITIFNGER